MLKKVDSTSKIKEEVKTEKLKKDPFVKAKDTIETSSKSLPGRIDLNKTDIKEIGRKSDKNLVVSNGKLELASGVDKKQRATTGKMIDALTNYKELRREEAPKLIALTRKALENKQEKLDNLKFYQKWFVDVKGKKEEIIKETRQLANLEGDFKLFGEFDTAVKNGEELKELEKKLPPQQKDRPEHLNQLAKTVKNYSALTDNATKLENEMGKFEHTGNLKQIGFSGREQVLRETKNASNTILGLKKEAVDNLSETPEDKELANKFVKRLDVDAGKASALAGSCFKKSSEISKENDDTLTDVGEEVKKLGGNTQPKKNDIDSQIKKINDNADQFSPEQKKKSEESLKSLNRLNTMLVSVDSINQKVKELEKQGAFDEKNFTKHVTEGSDLTLKSKKQAQLKALTNLGTGLTGNEAWVKRALEQKKTKITQLENDIKRMSEIENKILKTMDLDRERQEMTEKLKHINEEKVEINTQTSSQKELNVEQVKNKPTEDKGQLLKEAIVMVSENPSEELKSQINELREKLPKKPVQVITGEFGLYEEEDPISDAHGLVTEVTKEIEEYKNPKSEGPTFFGAVGGALTDMFGPEQTDEQIEDAAKNKLINDENARKDKLSKLNDRIKEAKNMQNELIELLVEKDDPDAFKQLQNLSQLITQLEQVTNVKSEVSQGQTAEEAFSELASIEFEPTGKDASYVSSKRAFKDLRRIEVDQQPDKEQLKNAKTRAEHLLKPIKDEAKKAYDSSEDWEKGFIGKYSVLSTGGEKLYFHGDKPNFGNGSFGYAAHPNYFNKVIEGLGDIRQTLVKKEAARELQQEMEAATKDAPEEQLEALHKSADYKRYVKFMADQGLIDDEE